MSLSALSRQLWKQREILESMLFKLEEERLTVATGSSRLLPRIIEELEAAVAKAQGLKLERAAEAEAVVVELGLTPHVFLKEIAAVTKEPWQTLLTQHREALMQPTSETAQTTQANQETLNSLQRAVQETLLGVPGLGETYGADGMVKNAGGQANFIDRAL